MNQALTTPPTTSGTSMQVIHLTEMHDIHEQPTSPVLDTVSPLLQVKARLQVCVGEMILTVGDLLSAKEHQVFALDRQVDQAVDILLEGKVVARGQLVAVDDHFAIRLSELPLPLKV